jgi:trehalose-6-phosphate synthase
MDEAIDLALSLSGEEQRERMASMAASVDQLSVDHWAKEQLEAIQ